MNTLDQIEPRVPIDMDGTAHLVIRNSAKDNASASYSFNVAGNKNAQVLSPGADFASSDLWANCAY